jgi:hypothetical protein
MFTGRDTQIIGAGRLLFFKVVSKIYSHHENVKVGYSRIRLCCLMPLSTIFQLYRGIAYSKWDFWEIISQMIRNLCPI